jgi:AraC family transcriptional regulator, 4-hydroxyphenylacetate 3-monooxygenase operon regulatory protein
MGTVPSADGLGRRYVMRNGSSQGTPIPNIDFGRMFELSEDDQDVHCASLGRLASFFGRNMVAHRHDRVFQVHLLTSGTIRLHLDDQFYLARAPLLFLTPPTVTHAFVISDDAEGQVVTVRQHFIWRLFKSDPSQSLERALRAPLCVELDRDHAPVTRMLDYFRMLGDEYAAAEPGRQLNLIALVRLVFVAIARLGAIPASGRQLRQSDVHLFQKFMHLIEEHYREHWPLVRYAAELNLTETRLNEICRRVADVPSKRFVHDRVLQEARRQLRFTSTAVSGIAYDLGFKDVSYFSRFFRTNIGCSPGEWRERVLCTSHEKYQ